MIAKHITVRGYHCDSYGHVNNARYLEFLEEARWSALEPLLKSKDFTSRNLLFIVVNININYRSEVKPNHVIAIHVDIAEFGRKSITFKQKIDNQSTGKTAVDAEVKFVLLNAKTKEMVTVEEDLKAMFKSLDNEN